MIASTSVARDLKLPTIKYPVPFVKASVSPTENPVRSKQLSLSKIARWVAKAAIACSFMLFSV